MFDEGMVNLMSGEQEESEQDDGLDGFNIDDHQEILDKLSLMDRD